LFPVYSSKAVSGEVSIMEFKDYYDILGVGRDATDKDIKRAYQKLARKFHPDVSQHADAEERFKEIGEAYNVLKDAEKRAAYDQLGENWQQGQEFRPPPGWDAGFEFSGSGAGGDSGAFSDFFESLFGHGFDRPGPGSGFRGRGEDHHAKVLIDLEDTYQGATRTISLQTPELDEQGHVRLRSRSLNVSIPKGVKPGQQIRLAGQGTAGPGGGPSGDLYLEIAFRQHPVYRIDGADIHLRLPVAPWEAALGATVKTPTPAGVVELSIPEGSGGGTRLRLRGRGIPAKQPGDLYVELQIALPPADSDRAREIYRTMERELGFNPRSEMEALT
jgi:curved DNA-binding protein